MQRKIIEQLIAWVRQEKRKPLILRGARQVGKTWVVRNLAEKLKLELLELNFERDLILKTLFNDNDPQKILLQLESFFNKSINPQNTLLFLDEIQAAPELLAKLRWFAEEQPELAVVATGSLLDFALDEHQFSMPVGRVSYLYLEPMSFEEFLLAQGQPKLYEFLTNFELHHKIPEVLHNRLLQFLREYVFVGGMPGVVGDWIEKKSPTSIATLQHNILQAYRDDFSKYAKRIAFERLEEVLRSVPRLIGKKFKYSNINQDVRSELLKKALHLLCQARVCSRVFSSASNGIPLDAEIKEKVFKVIFLDVGLVSAMMGLSFNEASRFNEIRLVNEGGIAEQLVGQLLRAAAPSYMDPKLYYWASEKSGSEAEIDYLLQCHAQIIPLEVKAGTTGKLRSLHRLMQAKGLKTALRFNADFPSVAKVEVKDHTGKLIQYELISLPFYLIEQVQRLVAASV